MTPTNHDRLDHLLPPPPQRQPPQTHHQPPPTIQKVYVSYFEGNNHDEFDEAKYASLLTIFLPYTFKL